jgi:hypothetical protein
LTGLRRGGCRESGETLTTGLHISWLFLFYCE